MPNYYGMTLESDLYLGFLNENYLRQSLWAIYRKQNKNRRRRSREEIGVSPAPLLRQLQVQDVLLIVKLVW
ncbi:hypothetical protein L3X38_039476 [Prunus dulcis]|uniref:Uncharacterized protein n=1 Tax=Prunus dulcis TaxID=3755 RepID=A0AAD4V8A3_PRUDU|nr:hypothetical protein L3X38_039476 [Prunus dulcis]